MTGQVRRNCHRVSGYLEGVIRSGERAAAQVLATREPAE